MKQVLQSLKTGELQVVQVPQPHLPEQGVLVHTHTSLVSAGTERMVVSFAEKNILQKARSRPDLVRQTVEKAQSEGVLSTWDAVQNRLDQPMALGYSCAGTIVAMGTAIPNLQVGDRVACAGGGHAVHAEIISVPRTLIVKIPENVPFEAATFATLGAIALQGIRLAEVKLGEVVAVIGLGLLGQLTVQMLKAAGCLVVGMDIQPQRAELAHQLGADRVTTTAEELETLCRQLSGGYGADAVLITADTKSNQPVEVAGQIARDKGVVVAVGAVGTELPRKIYYEKELAFHISRSYGPGRYDPAYEEGGQDYPYAYVRWTEQRNMQAFLQLAAEGKINIEPLISHRFPIHEAPQAYDLITGKNNVPFLGVLLTYPGQPDTSRKVILQANKPHHHPSAEKVTLGILGAGNFANATLLPILKDMADLELVGVASGGGVSARVTGDRFKFSYCTTEAKEVLTDPAINTVAILTRHHRHATQVISALQAGKHVFVEKPLCLNEAELQEIIQAYQTLGGVAGSDDGRSPLPSPYLMVGFNRRFAPFVVELKEHLASIQEPLMLHYRVNAGYIPPTHWTQDPAQGGGRLLGEGCHFIDLLIYLAGASPSRLVTRALPDVGRYSQDNLQITIEFANGSLGTITYVANGDKGFDKECLEVFGGGLAARVDNYRTLVIRHNGKRIKRSAWLRQDKGHRAEWEALVKYLLGKGRVPISFEEIVLSTRVTFAAHLSLQRQESVSMGEQSQ